MHRKSYRSYCIYGVRAFTYKVLTTLVIAHDSIVVSRFFQTHYENHITTALPKAPQNGRSRIPGYVTKNLNPPKRQADKLLLIYITLRLLTQLYRVMRSIFQEISLCAQYSLNILHLYPKTAHLE